MNPQSYPFPRSYWVQPGKLLAGFLPGSFDPREEAIKLEALLNCGVTHIINLMEEDEVDHSGRPFRNYRPALKTLAKARGTTVNWTRHPVKDMNIPAVLEMVSILDTVDAAVRAGCAYVHCWGGKGRTGTVIGCWLTRHGESGLTKLKELTAGRGEWCWNVPQTEAQRAFVDAWRVGQ